MKKRITVFVVLIMAMVLCLALTGCGQNTNKQDATTNDSHPGENFDTGDSSIMDGINNPGGIVQLDDDSYADDAAKDMNGNDNSGTGRNVSEDYSWQVGSYTLTTKINVMEYIDGNVWNANQMAAALGWDPIAMKTDGSYTANMKVKKPANFKSNGLLIYYSEAGSKCNGITGYIEGGDLVFNISAGTNSGDYSYRMNDADFYWTMEEIVCFAYAMENMPNSNDPFDSVLHNNGSSYTFE